MNYQSILINTISNEMLIYYRHTSFCYSSFNSTSRYCIYYELKVWLPVLSMTVRVTFPTARVYFVSLSHFGNSHDILFIIMMFVMVICDQWSLLLLVLTIFRNRFLLLKYVLFFKTKGYCTLWYKHSFYMHWETKNFVQYLLYCGGLQQTP